MKTSQSPKANINQELKEAFALWERKKGEKVYYSGKTSGDSPINLVAFIATFKKNPNQPDVQIYEQAEKGQDKQEVASLWQHTSKSGKLYYSGTTNEKEKLIAFINQDTKGGKYPTIRAYFKQDVE